MTLRPLRELLLSSALLLSACAADDAPSPSDAAEPNDAALGEPSEAGIDAGATDGAVQHDADSADDAALDASTDDAATADASVDAGPLVDRSDPKLHEFALDPHVLDPSTRDSPAIQYAQLDTRSAPLGQLVIFLPGATNVPRDWRDHGRKLAEFGFHVLIPHYDNRWSSNGTCDGKAKSCPDDTRWEALSGEDTSSAVDIARGDSAEGRVLTMLHHLIDAHAGGDWGHYLASDDTLAYGKIIIAGISHGAASAGMYAARRPFARNVMHASGPAGSSSGAKQTPVTAWYGFVHTADPAYAAITGAWNNFALPGAMTAIEGKAAPFDGSHRLTGSTTSTYPHGSVCAHSSSPKDTMGNYVFEPAWRYLYGAPAKP